MTDALTAYHDRQYNARAMIPDHEQIFELGRKRSEEARKTCAATWIFPMARVRRKSSMSSLPRATARRCWYSSTAATGGRATRAIFPTLPPAFVRHGVTLAVPNYGLCPKVGIEDIVKQNLLAIAWLWHHGARYGVNPGRLYVAGHSAGGHLTAMMLAARWNIYMPELPYNLVKGGLAISGIYDLEPLVHAPFVNQDLGLDQTLARRLSPANIPPATTAPLYTAVGGEKARSSSARTRSLREPGGMPLQATFRCQGATTLPCLNNLRVRIAPCSGARWT